MRNTSAEGYRYESVPTVGGQPPYPAELVARSKNLLNATLNIFGQLGLTTDAGALAFAKYPVHAQRATKVASVVGVEPVNLLTANLCYDLLLGLSVIGCSTLALPGADGPVLARNMGWFPPRRSRRPVASSPRTTASTRGSSACSASPACRTADSACLNAAFGGSDPAGYPVLLFLRHVLDSATSYADAPRWCGPSGDVRRTSTSWGAERRASRRGAYADRAVVRTAARPTSRADGHQPLPRPGQTGNLPAAHEYMDRHAGEEAGDRNLDAGMCCRRSSRSTWSARPRERPRCCAQSPAARRCRRDDPADLLGFLQ